MLGCQNAPWQLKVGWEVNSSWLKRLKAQLSAPRLVSRRRVGG